MNSTDVELAHNRSINHREEILASDKCGCFFCLKIYEPSNIHAWTDSDQNDVGQTALCPRCGIRQQVGISD